VVQRHRANRVWGTRHRHDCPDWDFERYHRKTFVVADPAQFNRLDLTIRIDDGFVVWINGTEVGRYNVPAGELAFNAVAVGAFEPDSRLLMISNPGSFLVAGTNIIAIHAFNQATTSSDIYLDASLVAESIAPTIVSFAPLPGLVSSLNQISVTFRPGRHRCGCR
jgi:hypothetical protein